MHVKLHSSVLLHTTIFLVHFTTKLQAEVIDCTSVARTRRKSTCCVKTKDLEYSEVKFFFSWLPFPLLCLLGSTRSWQ